MLKKVSLSPSALSVFRDCQRCFWIDRNTKSPRPRGIFPSLPNGMDLILKNHFDIHRRAGTVPPELIGVVEGSLYKDFANLDRWRNWRTGLKAETPLATCSGALDDLWVEPDGTHSPFDFKTKGSKPGGVDYAEKYYQAQMDIYALMFEQNGLKPSGKAHLAFYSPSNVMVPTGAAASTAAEIIFDVTVLTIPVDTLRAKDLINRAAECLGGPMPDPAPACEFCAFHKTRAAIVV